MSSASDPHSDAALDIIARHLYQIARKYKSEKHLEVEMRLCHFDVPRPSKSKETFAILRSGQTKNKIKVGVTAAQFQQIKEAVTAASPAEAEEPAEKKIKLDDAGAAPAPVTSSSSPSPQVEESITEDITVGSSRYSYRVLRTAGGERKVPQTAMHKKRLEVADVRLYNCPYDVRLSISSEAPSATAVLPPAAAPKGYTRRKMRTSVTFPAAHTRYDLTCVGAGQEQTYEVELEGVFDDVETQLTEQWVAAALRGLLQWSGSTL